MINFFKKRANLIYIVLCAKRQVYEKLHTNFSYHKKQKTPLTNGVAASPRRSFMRRRD